MSIFIVVMGEWPWTAPQLAQRYCVWSDNNLHLCTSTKSGTYSLDIIFVQTSVGFLGHLGRVSARFHFKWSVSYFCDIATVSNLISVHLAHKWVKLRVMQHTNKWQTCNLSHNFYYLFDINPLSCNFSGQRNEPLVQDNNSENSSNDQPIRRIGSQPTRSANFNDLPQNPPNRPYLLNSNTSMVNVVGPPQGNTSPDAVFDKSRYYPGVMNTGGDAMNPPRYSDRLSTLSQPNGNIYSYSPSVGSLGPPNTMNSSGNVSVVPVDYRGSSYS